jgi:hypothetical protein
MKSSEGYVRQIQQKLITEYGFHEHAKHPGVPTDVPDDIYPMEIDGRVDNVRVVQGHIEFCNFRKQSA